MRVLSKALLAIVGATGIRSSTITDSISSKTEVVDALNNDVNNSRHECLIPVVECLAPDSDDQHHVFEGVEKRIEIYFDTPHPASESGLRDIPRASLDIICDHAQCKIIRHERKPCFDSYILSESSLFVFPDRVIMKTCGTTLPLGAVNVIIAEADKIGAKPLDMTYSRSSFLFPDLQLVPHNDLQAELVYLDGIEFSGTKIPGISYVLGDVNGKYWLVHRKQLGHSKCVVEAPNRIMVDCIMTGLSGATCAHYFKNINVSIEENQEAMADVIRGILPEFKEISGECFEPCGYSCNAHDADREFAGDRYFTVHITPEEAFNYASMETVFYTDPENPEEVREMMHKFIENIASVFKPKTLAVTVLSPSDAIIDQDFLAQFANSAQDKYYVVDSRLARIGSEVGASDVIASFVMYKNEHELAKSMVFI